MQSCLDIYILENISYLILELIEACYKHTQDIHTLLLYLLYFYVFDHDLM